mmetsp:Transcript_29036/g.83913  ORF Transcript_29036/g.83913 Transcript_29036/m.83913 type:complete len:96 (-) Transcript_29036:704-991(-)
MQFWLDWTEVPKLGRNRQMQLIMRPPTLASHGNHSTDRTADICRHGWLQCTRRVKSSSNTHIHHSHPQPTHSVMKGTEPIDTDRDLTHTSHRIRT